jgi:hypothetical protein
MSSSTQNPPVTPMRKSKKRKVSSSTSGATLPAPVAPAPASPAPSIADIDYDMGVMEATAGITELATDGAKKTAEAAAPALEHYVFPFGDFHDGKFPAPDDEDLAHYDAVMKTAVETGSDRLDVVIFRSILANDDDDWQLMRQFENKFAGTRAPYRWEVTSGHLLYRSGKPTGGTLVPNLDLTFRSVKNRSFMWALPLQAAWPPALVIQPAYAASAVWDFKLACPPGKDLDTLEILGNALVKHYKGAFFAVVCVYFGPMGSRYSEQP